MGWLAWLALVPVAVVADAARVVAMLARPLRLRHATGELQEYDLPAEKGETAAGRVALGGAMISAAPGSYLIDEKHNDDASDGGKHDGEGGDSAPPVMVLHALVEGRPQLPERVAGGRPVGRRKAQP